MNDNSIRPKFCRKCGSPLREDSNFCEYCGNAVVYASPEKETVSEAHAKQTLNIPEQPASSPEPELSFPAPPAEAAYAEAAPTPKVKPSASWQPVHTPTSSFTEGREAVSATDKPAPTAPSFSESKGPSAFTPSNELLAETFNAKKKKKKKKKKSGKKLLIIALIAAIVIAAVCAVGAIALLVSNWLDAPYSLGILTFEGEAYDPCGFASDNSPFGLSIDLYLDGLKEGKDYEINDTPAFSFYNFSPDFDYMGVDGDTTVSLYTNADGEIEHASYMFCPAEDELSMSVAKVLDLLTNEYGEATECKFTPGTVYSSNKQTSISYDELLRNVNSLTEGHYVVNWVREGVDITVTVYLYKEPFSVACEVTFKE